VSAGDRLTQLRALVDRLERLPASTRRDWMLTEARARMVDVETGEPPRAMRPLAADPPSDSPKPPPRRTAGTGPPKRPPERRAPTAEKRRGVVGSPVAPPVAKANAPPVDVGDEPRIARPESSADSLGTGEVLWLEDSPADDSASADERGDANPYPWRRGLRG
jgi:hypothetical protein